MKNRQAFSYKARLLFIALLLVASVAHALEKSLLWEISGNGLKQPSYLYGTMHTADARVISLSKDRIYPYFDKANAYAMEIDVGNSDLNLNARLLSKLMMGSGYSLTEMIPEKEYQVLDSLVSDRVGFSMTFFDNVAPVFVLTVLQSVSMGLSDSLLDGNNEMLDMYLYRLANEADKGLIGIETVGEQLKALGALSYEEQADLLTEEIGDIMAGNSEAVDVVKHYLNQDLDSLAANDDMGEMPEKLYKALVTDRNIRMADRISRFIQSQSVFIAIGALHLPGNEGVIALLRDQGYKVEAVK